MLLLLGRCGHEKREDTVVVVQAYILVQTVVGRSTEVMTEIRRISGVTLAEDVTGPYDVVVRVGATSLEDLTSGVVPSVQQASGITRTLTCPVAEAGRL